MSRDPENISEGALREGLWANQIVKPAAWLLQKVGDRAQNRFPKDSFSEALSKSPEVWGPFVAAALLYMPSLAIQIIAEAAEIGIRELMQRMQRG